MMGVIVGEDQRGEGQSQSARTSALQRPCTYGTPDCHRSYATSCLQASASTTVSANRCRRLSDAWLMRVYGALEGVDREVVETLFLERALVAVFTTSTLA
eukprot:2201749-Rhodomonas_salina.1